jgi:hypothetical protein
MAAGKAGGRSQDLFKKIYNSDRLSVNSADKQRDMPRKTVFAMQHSCHRRASRPQMRLEL